MLLFLLFEEFFILLDGLLVLEGERLYCLGLVLELGLEGADFADICFDFTMITVCITTLTIISIPPMPPSYLHWPSHQP